MKRTYILAILFILSFNSLIVRAAEVPLRQLKTAGMNWLKETAQFQPTATYSLVDSSIEIYAKGQNRQLLAVVFPLKPLGFVVLTTDNRLNPVIAYSFRNPFRRADEENNVLLNFIRHDISLRLQAVEKGFGNVNRYQEQWRYLTDTTAVHKAARVSGQIYGPHLSSVWGQGSVWNQVLYEYERVFNRYTPNAWSVGCVATAMAQDLNYYQWPINGVGSHSYTEDDAGTLSADFGNTYYAWSQMLDNYGTQLTTLEQKNAAGLLSYHCAVSVNMDFESDGSTSSTSDVPYALHTYFRYTGHYEEPGSYSSFYSRLRTNMKNSRVDIVALSDGSTYGHTVDCDGYNEDNGYYHLNMGWLGSSNGWYDLEGSFNAGGYTSVTGAVLDIFPEPQITKITADEGNEKTLTIYWRVSPQLNADYYQLQQKLGSDGTWSTLSSSIADTFYTTTVSSEGTYYYRVRAHVDGYWWDDSYSVSYGYRTTSNGDYRTKAGGSWNTTSIWQIYNNGWQDASSAPTSSDGAITICEGHTVDVTSTVTVDQLKIESGAQITVKDGVDFKVNNGSGTDLRVFGTLRKEGSGRILYVGSGTTTAKFFDGSLFQLAGSNKYILVADWDENSTIEISGNIGGDMTSTYHTDQDFGNFIWDCSGQTSNVYFSGALTSIQGDFELRNTNGYEFRLTGTSGGDPTVSIHGDVHISGGLLNLTSGDNNIYFVCYQNFEQSGGTIKATGSGTGYLRFGPASGGGSEGSFTHSGGIFTPENIRINNTYTLTLNSNMNIGSAPFSVEGVLDCGSYQISGSGTFTLSTSGRIKIGHPDGLNGNIITSGKSFSSAGDYEFTGTANQVTGTDLPTSLTDGFIIDCDGDVSLSQSTQLSGGNTGLILRNGRLNTSDAHLLTLANDGGWWGGSDNSFVNGPMAKIRESTNPFSYPTGKGARFRRCRIIPAASDQATFKAEYFDQGYSDTTSLGAGLEGVNGREYWRVERTSGNTATQIGMYWEEEGEISDYSTVTVARWDGNAWQDAGAAEKEGDNASGRVTSNVLSDLGVFTFGQTVPSALSNTGGGLPGKIELAQNFPNPFNSVTTIKYALPKAGKIRLEVFNVLGQRVATLFNGNQKAGQHQIRFNANRLSSGVYYYRLLFDGRTQIHKFVLVK